jgi:tetratricopeptide (TPR) repeat protein
MAYWCIGDLRNAENFIEKGQKVADANNCSDTYMIATGNLGLVNLVRGKLPQALTLMQRHYELALALNHEKEMVRAQANRGIVHFFLENYEEAARDLKIDVKHSQGETEGISLAYASLGVCYLRLGKIEEAREYTEQALWIARKNDLTHARISALRAAAEVANDVDLAREYLVEALELASGRSEFQEAACLLSLGKLLADTLDGIACYQDGKRKLEAMGGGAWIRSDSIHDAPFIAML